MTVAQAVLVTGVMVAFVIVLGQWVFVLRPLEDRLERLNRRLEKVENTVRDQGYKISALTTPRFPWHLRLIQMVTVPLFDRYYKRVEAERDRNR